MLIDNTPDNIVNGSDTFVHQSVKNQFQIDRLMFYEQLAMEL